MANIPGMMGIVLLLVGVYVVLFSPFPVCHSQLKVNLLIVSYSSCSGSYQVLGLNENTFFALFAFALGILALLIGAAIAGRR